MRPVSISSLRKWWQSGYGCCMSWSPRPCVSPCSSILPTLPSRRTQCGTRSKPLTSSGCKSRSTMRVRSPRSTRPSLLFVAADAFFVSRRGQLATLTARDRVPATYPDRDFVAGGGLMSYGADILDMFQGVGIYTGKVLQGTKPADMPVQQTTKFEFTINLQTARALGIEIPSGLLAIADEVIE